MSTTSTEVPGHNWLYAAYMVVHFTIRLTCFALDVSIYLDLTRAPCGNRIAASCLFAAVKTTRGCTSKTRGIITNTGRFF